MQAALNNSYKTHSANWGTAFELFLDLLYAGFLAWALYQSYGIVTPFLAHFAIGFFYTSLLSVKETRAQSRAKIETNPNIPALTETSNYAKPAELLLIAE